MIDHKLKCIFIHIQRTGGSSIEHWIAGCDWWQREPQSKHILASQAKALYGEWWDEYFKFSFVRDPVARVRSCLKFAEYFGLGYGPGGDVDFSGYHAFFGAEIVLEHDRRFYRREDVANARHVAGAVYGNILDEDIDFIGRFETLREDTQYLRDRLAIAAPFASHLENSAVYNLPAALDAAAVAHIGEIYREDYARFGYARPDSAGKSNDVL